MRTKQEYQNALNELISELHVTTDNFGWKSMNTLSEKDLSNIAKLQELIDNIKENEKEIAKKIDDIYWQHPYKVIGNRDSYCEYNQGWSDAIDLVEQALGIDNLKENE